MGEIRVSSADSFIALRAWCRLCEKRPGQSSGAVTEMHVEIISNPVCVDTLTPPSSQPQTSHKMRRYVHLFSPAPSLPPSLPTPTRAKVYTTLPYRALTISPQPNVVPILISALADLLTQGKCMSTEINAHSYASALRHILDRDLNNRRARRRFVPWSF